MTRECAVILSQQIETRTPESENLDEKKLLHISDVVIFNLSIYYFVFFNKIKMFLAAFLFLFSRLTVKMRERGCIRVTGW